MNTAATPEARPVPLPTHYRRNLFLLIADFVFFMVGITFVSGQTVLPDFVGRLSGSEVLVGLVGILFPLGVMLPQLVVAPMAARAPSKRLWIIKAGFPGRLMMFVVAGGILLFGVENPLPVLVIVFLGVGMFAVCDGITAVAWMDLLSNALPNTRRGRLFGLGRAIASIAVLLVVSDLVRYILDAETGPSYPHDYMLLFFLAGIFMLLSISMFLFVREPAKARPVEMPSASRRGYLAFLGQVLRQDRRYRHFLATRLTYQVALIAAPFYIRFATESLAIPSAVAVSGAIQVTTIGSLVAGLAMGRLSEKRGSRAVILMTCAFALAQPAMALVAGAGAVWPIYLTFALMGMTTAAYEPGMLNWIIEYADDSRRAVYYSLTSAFNLIGVLSPGLGGVIAESLSYEALFVVALSLSLLALMLALRLVEPRALTSSEVSVAVAETAPATQ